MVQFDGGGENRLFQYLDTGKKHTVNSVQKKPGVAYKTQE